MPRHIRARTDTCVYVSMHALRTYLFIRMCARIYRCEYVSVYICTCVYAHVRALSLSLSTSPFLSLSLSLSLSVSLSLSASLSPPPSLPLTFKLPEQFHDLPFLPGGFVSFGFGSTSKSYAFIDLAVVMESGAYLVDPY